MSLRDQSCYTLILQQSAVDPAVVELVEVVGTKREARYARVREQRPDGGEVYSSVLYDFFNGAKLAATGYSAERGSKQRRLQLHGPDEEVPFDLTAKMSFEWTFVFGGNRFRWTREIYGKDYICSLDRKPDHKVEICLARSVDKNDPARIQILHYNLERFPNEITDLRGLETLLIMTFMSFIDASEERSSRPVVSPPIPSPKMSPPLSGSGSASGGGMSALGQTTGRPAPQQAVVPEDFEAESENEIRVGRQSDIDERIARAVGLLMDPSVLFVIIRTAEPAVAQKALQIALGVTRFRHREGLADLHQYVVEQTEPDPPSKPAKGPKVIKLDDPVTPTPTPKRPSQPSTCLNISIYLSTIQLPDLVPKVRPVNPTNGQSAKPGQGSNPKPPAQELRKSSGSSKPPAQPIQIPSQPVPSLPPLKSANKPAPAKAPAMPSRPSPSQAIVNPIPKPSKFPKPQTGPSVAALPHPSTAPPRPPPPSAAGEGKAKSDSVVKKLIAMSRR